MDSVGEIASALDSGTGESAYTAAVDSQREALKDYDRLPSAAMLRGMSGAKLPFAKYAMALSEDHQNYFSKNRLNAESRTRLEKMASDSLAKQIAIEEADEVSFEKNFYGHISQNKARNLRYAGTISKMSYHMVTASRTIDGDVCPIMIVAA